MTDSKPAAHQTPVGSEPNQPAPPRAAIAFILVTLLIDILGLGIIIPILPELVKQFVGGDVSTAGMYVGIISSTYALTQFVCAPIVGALSDRFGRRPILLACMFGFGVDFLIQGFAPNIGWLFVGRFIAGIMGASFTTANAYIADISDENTRARNFGLVGVMFGIGFIIGPMLGGWLGEYNLRLPFFAAAGLALTNWLYGFLLLPESLPPAARSEFTLRNANPLGTLRFLRTYPLVSGIALAVVCSSLAQRGLENVWVLHAGYRYGWDNFTNGMTLGLVGVMAVIVQGGVVGPAVRRFGPRRTAIFATFVSALAFLGYALADQGWVVPIVIVFGSLGGLAGPSLQSLVATQVPAGDQGKVQGALTSVTSLTSVVAPVIFSTVLFGYFTSIKPPIPGAPFYLGSGLLVLAAMILWRVFKRFPGDCSAKQPPE